MVRRLLSRRARLTVPPEPAASDTGQAADPQPGPLPDADGTETATPATVVPPGYEQALGAPYLAAVAVVSQPGATDLAFPRFGPRTDPDAPPEAPPRELWTVAEDFLVSGERDAATMRDALDRAGEPLAAGTAILDLGCGPGRVLRWLPTHLDGWGVDLDADRIAWCQSELSPPFRFATCGTYPHLPFGDGRFDVVYAGSVFTHISELADAWLLEALRITVPGGLLYLTVHDQGTVAFCREKDPESPTRALTGFAQPADTERRVRAWSDRLGADLDGFTFGRGYYSQVFYDRDTIVAHWARFAEVVEVLPEAFAGHQTAVLLRRRTDDRAWR